RTCQGWGRKVLHVFKDGRWVPHGNHRATSHTVPAVTALLERCLRLLRRRASAGKVAIGSHTVARELGARDRARGAPGWSWSGEGSSATRESARAARSCSRCRLHPCTTSRPPRARLAIGIHDAALRPTHRSI